MLDILTILNNIGYNNLTDRGTHWSSTAIYRQGDNPTALSINKENGNWHDFVENTGGKFEELIRKTLNLPTGTNITSAIPDFSIPTIIKQDVELTETKKFDKKYLIKLKKDNIYWNNRGISNPILDSLQGGIGPSPGRMQDRYVFPIFEKENIIGFAGRKLTNSSSIKWKLVGKKSEWIFPNYAINSISEKKSVIVVESIGDSLSLSEAKINNNLVLFGIDISSKIICLLLKLDVNQITILLNNDSQNNFAGNQGAIEIKQKLLNHFDEQQINIVTPPEPYNDLNEYLCNDKQGFIDFCKSKELF